MKCPKCEKENITNTNLCEHCGSEMFDAVDTQTVEKQDEAPKKKSKKKVIITVVAVIVAIATAVAGVLFVLNEREKQRQEDAKTGITLADFSNKVEDLSENETDDGVIGTYHDDNYTKYTVVADEYRNARKITLNCEINMTPGSQPYERLMTLSSYEIYNTYVAGYSSDLTLNKIYVDTIIMDGTDVYCMIADIDTKDNSEYMQAIDDVLSLQSGKKVINDWEMTLTYTNDYLRFEAIYVG